jgi:hypothetical protein
VAKIRGGEATYESDRLDQRAGRVVSYLLGVAFGRWGDFSTGEEIIQVDDSDPSSRIDSALKSVVDNDEEMRDQLESDLGDSIETWLKKSYFRHHHCKEYRRRGQRNPIYWQLESPDGAFSCFVYYHEIDENTLPKLRGQYIDPRIDELENELETLNAQTSGENPDKELLNRKEQVEEALDDIKTFRETIDQMIDDGVTVDFEEGIWENIKEWDQYEVLETGLPKLKSSYSR